MIKKEFLPKINGEEPIKAFIIVFNNIDIDYIQTYLKSDYPKYNKVVDIEIEAAGIDIFIGEEEYIHKGYGKDIITIFLKEYVFELYNISHCIIGPEPKNKSAIRAYEKVGFKYLKTVKVPHEDEPEHIMIINSKDIDG